MEKFKLRFMSVYNEHGYDVIDNELQYWDEDAKEWREIPRSRCRFNRYDPTDPEIYL